MIAETARILEDRFRKELSENWPAMEGIESFFVERQPGFQDTSIIIVTEICYLPDGTLAQSRLRVSRRQNAAWRVLDVLSDENEVDESEADDSSVQRHERMVAVGGLPEGEGRYRDAILRHIEAFWGQSELIYEDPEQNYVRLRVHLVRPTPERPFYTLVTSGMSDRPMVTPQGAEEYSLAELVISLPRNWNIDQLNSDDDRHAWPLNWLKHLARFPHQYGTWLFMGHTVPNGEPPEPFAPRTNFSCMVLSAPVLCADDGHELAITGETSVHFCSVIPIFQEEMDFALNHSSEDLLGRLEEAEVTELLDPKRKNVCA
jgi:hypothetical protein